MSRALILCVLALVWTTQAQAREQVLVAVAANFAQVARALEPEFEARHDADIVLVVGATGQLYAQIRAGAPYQVFLAADQARPQRMETEGLAIKDSRRTYAVGQLALWSPDPARVIGPQSLQGDGFIAMANPDLAPYGTAAAQVLAQLQVETKGRLAMGQNVGQAFAMVATGNADLGFVAQSALGGQGGSHWLVPSDLHDPILQDAVLIQGAGEMAAAFLEFLSSVPARAVISKYGYEAVDG
ncbi:molybdate ABC transporter substrate-binding protein [Actibacterium atlanticum]|uniref:molybdate ABC transporter substrate-binding protein n=1 Tax=Actibacterium atlanticum TaxID=1461693 RepID=UPI000550DA11|nr:molybdate ABC transporter substrate-binding protein [Actibacterium atlanticum]